MKRSFFIVLKNGKNPILLLIIMAQPGIGNIWNFWVMNNMITIGQIKRQSMRIWVSYPK